MKERNERFKSPFIWSERCFNYPKGNYYTLHATHAEPKVKNKRNDCRGFELRILLFFKKTLKSIFLKSSPLTYREAGKWREYEQRTAKSK